MAVTESTKIKLAFLSGGICAFPNCGTPLVKEVREGKHDTVYHAAHICGQKRGSARYVTNMTDQERDHISNLLYLCQNHHAIIDGDEEEWTIERLREMKHNHENKAWEAIENGFADVAFPELRAAVAWVAKQEPGEVGNFEIIKPSEKIDKNRLSSESKNLILAGVACSQTVTAYIEKEAQQDNYFPERLKCYFTLKYISLRNEGRGGDDLFNDMCAFAQQGLDRQAERIAALGMLVYLFEICEVFEK